MSWDENGKDNKSLTNSSINILEPEQEKSTSAHLQIAPSYPSTAGTAVTGNRSRKSSRLVKTCIDFS